MIILVQEVYMTLMETLIMMMETMMMMTMTMRGKETNGEEEVSIR